MLDIRNASFDQYSIEACKHAILSNSRKLLGLPAKGYQVVPVEYEYMLAIAMLKLRIIDK